MMSRLGEALLRQGRYADAEPWIVDAYNGLVAREGQIPPTAQPVLVEAASRACRLYDAWGRPDRAAAWKRKVGLPDLPADPFAKP